MTAYTNILAQIVKTIATWEIKSILGPLIKISQTVILFISLFSDIHKDYPKQALITGGQSYDIIIIGGGTAGCVLANRLTENPKLSVLLIENGDLPSLVSMIPGMFPLIENSKEEWGFYSTDNGYSSQGVKGKQIHLTAGKMLGGTSGITYLLYARGDKEDYNKWAELGNKGWDWDSVLPYFKKAESINDIEIYRGNTSHLHGKNGPIRVSRPKWNDITADYLEGFRQNGRAILTDVNGKETVGYGMAQLTVDEHYRQSTGLTYIKPIRKRKNLNLLLNTMVTKITINEKKEATGVEILLNNGKTIIVHAKREVILCAGALNSPKILMLSGIGPRRHLKQIGINVIVDSPNVGQNFKDTPLVLLGVTGRRGFLKSFSDNILDLTSFHSFPSALILGHGTLKKKQRSADYQLNALAVPAGTLIPAVFCSTIFRYEDETCIALSQETLPVETLFAAHNLMHPLSTGNVTLRSADPKEKPKISTGFYSNPEDLERHAQYIQDFFSVINTEKFKSFNSRIIDLKLEKCKHFEFNCIDYWKCYILQLTSPQWNFSGTCIMGVEGTGVVDDRLCVRGVKGLRVVDASVIPRPVTGNNVAVVVMIAEKASDMIKEDYRNFTEKSSQ